MINLLPQFEKKKLLREYRLRAGIIVLCAVLMLELLTAALLSPSYYRITAAEEELRTELAAKKQVATSTGEEDPQKKIALIQAEALLLNPPLRPNDLPTSQILGEILAQKPSGIGVHSFSYAKTSASVAAVQLTGVAGTREDLLAFQRLLKENPHFSDMKYAQSFLTRKTDIDFQLTVMIK